MPTWISRRSVVIVGLQTVSATWAGWCRWRAGVHVEFGWNESWVGYLTAANIVGALFALTAGIGMMHRLGGVRALQMEPADRCGDACCFISCRRSRWRCFASACVGLEQRHRQSGRQRGADALDAAGAPQPGVLDQAGRRAARRRARRPRHSAADRGDGLAATPRSSSPPVCIAATLLTWPFQSRIDLPREQRMQRRLDSFRLTDILVPLRSLSHGDRLLARVVGRRAAGGAASRLGHVRGDLSRGRAGPVAAAPPGWCSR